VRRKKGAHSIGAAVEATLTLTLQSARRESATDHVKVKTEMLQLKLASARREMVRRADVDALIDGIAGDTLTALSTQATWIC
jgi:hypothetical protein